MKTYRPVAIRLQKKPDEICEPFTRSDRLIGMRVRDSATRTYRATFAEYARKLEILQRLLESNLPDSAGIQEAMRDVEIARKSYHSAREFLASELGVGSSRAAAAACR